MVIWPSGWRGPSPGFHVSVWTGRISEQQYCMGWILFIARCLGFPQVRVAAVSNSTGFRSSRTLVLDMIHASRFRTHIHASLCGNSLVELHTLSSCDWSRFLSSILVLFLTADAECQVCLPGISSGTGSLALCQWGILAGCGIDAVGQLQRPDVARRQYGGVFSLREETVSTTVLLPHSVAFRVTLSVTTLDPSKQGTLHSDPQACENTSS